MYLVIMECQAKALNLNCDSQLVLFVVSTKVVKNLVSSDMAKHWVLILVESLEYSTH